jgi:hypothetical protein
MDVYLWGVNPFSALVSIKCIALCGIIERHLRQV